MKRTLLNVAILLSFVVHLPVHGQGCPSSTDKDAAAKLIILYTAYYNNEDCSQFNKPQWTELENCMRSYLNDTVGTIPQATYNYCQKLDIPYSIRLNYSIAKKGYERRCENKYDAYGRKFPLYLNNSLGEHCNFDISNQI